MAIFKLNLKTKNGNDIKDKKVINCIYSSRMTHNHLTSKVEYYYNFKIISDFKCPDSFLTLKLKSGARNIQESIFKIILNILYYVKGFCKKNNLNPDFIILNSPELKGDLERWLKRILINYNLDKLNRRFYKSYKILFDSFNDYIKYFNNTKILIIDPSKEDKYKKSLSIYNNLKETLKYGEHRYREGVDV